MVEFGLLKCGVLKKLKNSIRNCRLREPPSWKSKFLKNDRPSSLVARTLQTVTGQRSPTVADLERRAARSSWSRRWQPINRHLKCSTAIPPPAYQSIARAGLARTTKLRTPCYRLQTRAQYCGHVSPLIHQAWNRVAAAQPPLRARLVHHVCGYG